MNKREAEEIYNSPTIVTGSNFQQAKRRKEIADAMGLGMNEIRAYAKGYLECYAQVEPFIEASQALMRTGLNYRLIREVNRSDSQEHLERFDLCVKRYKEALEKWDSLQGKEK